MQTHSSMRVPWKSWKTMPSTSCRVNFKMMQLKICKAKPGLFSTAQRFPRLKLPKCIRAISKWATSSRLPSSIMWKSRMVNRRWSIMETICRRM